MELKRIRLTDLHPAEYNPRQDLQPGDPEYEKIRASLALSGLVDPIIVRTSDLLIIGGHQRLKVLQAAGITDLHLLELGGISWVFSEDELPAPTDTDAKALNIALNKITGAWDLDKLNVAIQDLEIQGVDIEITGFDAEEIEAMFAGANAEPKQAKEDNFEPPAEIETDIAPGDIYQLGKHRVMCGDFTNRADVDKLMQGNRANMVFADPPFNVGYKAYDDNNPNYDAWLQTCINTCSDICCDDSAFYFMNIPRNFYIVCKALEEIGTFQNLIVWPHGTGLIPSTRFAEQWEGILIYKKGSPPFNTKAETKEAIISDERGGGLHSDGRINDVWDDIKVITAGCRASKEAILKEGTREKSHSAQMPLALPSRGISFQTNENDLVVDPFLGSGTTLIACEQLGRVCYGMEISPQYCEIICSRWEKLTGQTRQKVGGTA